MLFGPTDSAEKERDIVKQRTDEAENTKTLCHMDRGSDTSEDREKSATNNPETEIARANDNGYGAAKHSQLGGMFGGDEPDMG
jgi:hypothetical protein